MCPAAPSLPFFSKLSNLKINRASQVVLVVKNLPASAGDPGSIPGSGRSLGREDSPGNLAYSPKWKQAPPVTRTSP